MYEVAWVELQLGKGARWTRVVLVGGLPCAFVLGFRDIGERGIVSSKHGGIRVWGNECGVEWEGE